MRYSTIAVIYNPNSTGSGEKLARQFEAKVREQLPKQKIELVQTEHAGHGEELSYEIAKASKHPLIVSSSGDGGYHDVVNGAMRATREGFAPTTSLLPAGNANDHYTNLHTTDLVEQIVSGEPGRIDVLKITSKVEGRKFRRYAHSYIGFGLTPFVGDALNKEKLNPVKEVFVVARALLTIKPVRLKIGRKPRAYESVIFSNIDVMSKYLKISQPSSVTDGKFEVTIFTRRNKLRLILLLLDTSLRGVKEDTQVRKFSLKTVNETLVQADGEIFTLDAKTRTIISVEKQALQTII
jgi:diacylglycerol kinase family enzyme